MYSLSEIKLNTKHRINHISELCGSKRYLEELGFLENVVVSAVHAGDKAGNGPVAYDVMGSIIALRKADSGLIFLKDNDNETDASQDLHDLQKTKDSQKTKDLQEWGDCCSSNGAFDE